VFSIRSYCMALFYDAAMKKTEQLCLRVWRNELISAAWGDVLEIGAGTGLNLEHYPATVDSLVLTEPDANMRKQLARRVKSLEKPTVTLTPFAAEAIDLPDESFDHIVSTLVLCSVENQSRSLLELYRLLRPGGTLRFLEHVLAEDNPKLVRWQKTFEPIWNFCCGNCHLTRNTGEEIRRAGFVMDQLQTVKIAGAPLIVQPAILGTAKKPH
jgi:ubiquinone/menaquinone biosynthesis C-methylase UbiE